MSSTANTYMCKLFAILHTAKTSEKMAMFNMYEWKKNTNKNTQIRRRFRSEFDKIESIKSSIYHLDEFLLYCTNTYFSIRCQSEVNRWKLWLFLLLFFEFRMGEPMSYMKWHLNTRRATCIFYFIVMGSLWHTKTQLPIQTDANRCVHINQNWRAACRIFFVS